MPDQFCPNCGTEVDADARFCPTCGQSLLADAQGATADTDQLEIPAAPGWPDADDEGSQPADEPADEPAAEPADEPTMPSQRAAATPPPAPEPEPAPEREPEPVAPPPPMAVGEAVPPPPPPPAGTATGGEASGGPDLPFTLPTMLSGWLIGAGTGFAALALLPGLGNLLNLLLFLALLGITASVFLADRMPDVPRLRFLVLVVIMVALGVALDRAAFTVRGVDTIFLIAMLVAAGGALILELGHDRPLPPPDPSAEG